jgi:AraC-like DNA-binding protein
MGRIAPDPSWHMKKHDHDNNELIIITGGSMTITKSKTRAWQGTAGDVFLYPAGCAHAERSDTQHPVELLFIAFTGNMGNSIITVSDKEGKVRLMGGWLYQVQPEQFSGKGDLQQSYLETILQEFHRIRAGSNESEMVSQVRRFMHSHLAEPITLDDLAEAARMSRFHFCREYKKQANITPAVDLKRIRLEEARVLLTSTTLPLKTVAPMVGFVNEYHLAREFKRQYGNPPGHYRK